jgi:hypothetical protein
MASLSASGSRVVWCGVPIWANFVCLQPALMQILEEQHALFFHLQQQRLIELIRSGNTSEALAFAQEYLAPHGEENEAFLEELGESTGVCFWDVDGSDSTLHLVYIIHHLLNYCQPSTPSLLHTGLLCC